MCGLGCEHIHSEGIALHWLSAESSQLLAQSIVPTQLPQFGLNQETHLLQTRQNTVLVPVRADTAYRK
jgi:hypothetical protein